MLNLIKNIALRFASIFFTFLIFGIVISTINFLGSFNSKIEKPQVKSKFESVDYNYSNYHNWKDNYQNYHSGNFRVGSLDVKSSLSNKRSGNPQSWNQLYKQIYFHDKTKLNEVYKIYSDIYNSGSFTSKQFADFVVSSVQYIPYVLTIQDNCSDAYFKDIDVKQMIDDGTKCKGSIYAGLYSPLEFMRFFEGDCDTRTLFIYTVLKHFGYDVKILNSEVYGHSIIGLNLPSRGSYKVFLGKRYYTWETTSKYWELGDIPPETSNMNYWYVEL
jgi:hypothetical protein